ncbi:hypothetical protein [Exiguobacterium sp. s150]|uniref:hypothetical protein n=1 Tax=Exiguobacterium sp. s150 TaxID=2751221 RepID=UPI001BE5B9F1|nr:hypothetical protein [Exiguobacterium sp. s150]
MILRHSTHIYNVASILQQGGISSSFNSGNKDEGYLSLELDPPTDFLKNNLHLLKENRLRRGDGTILPWNKEDTIALDFDLHSVEQSGIAIVNDRSGKPVSAYLDIKFGLCQKTPFIEWPEETDIKRFEQITTENIFSLIGEYRFIHSFLSLEYLREESRISLDSLAES